MMCGTRGGLKDLTYWLMWVSRSSGDPLVFLYWMIWAWLALKQSSKKALVSSRRVQHAEQMEWERSSVEVI